MKLWRHQVEAIEVCAAAHQGERSRVLVQFPTGTGKSEVAIQVALQWLAAHAFGRVLIVVPTSPILQQFRRRLAQVTRTPIAIDQAELHAPRSARLVLASQNSLWDRLPQYRRDVLVIYDECHHSNLDADENLRIATSFDHVVGMTASPWSRGCLALFGGAARVRLGLDEAQARGILARHELRPWAPPQGPHGIVFCASNSECAELSRAHPGSTWVGVNSGQVPERIAAWKAGRHGVIYANRMLLEGFDEPRCGNVWIARSTESDIMYVQMVGRCLRFAVGKVARIYYQSEEIRAGLERALDRARVGPDSSPI